MAGITPYGAVEERSRELTKLFASHGTDQMEMRNTEVLVSNTETRLSHKRKKGEKGVLILSGNIAIAGNQEMRLKSVGKESNSAIPG